MTGRRREGLAKGGSDESAWAFDFAVRPDIPAESKSTLVYLFCTTRPIVLKGKINTCSDLFVLFIVCDHVLILEVIICRLFQNIHPPVVLKTKILYCMYVSGWRKVA